MEPDPPFDSPIGNRSWTVIVAVLFFVTVIAALIALG